MKAFLELLIIIAFLNKIQAQKCEVTTNMMFCNNITLDPGKFLEANGTHDNVTEISAVNSSIPLFPTGFLNDFKKAEKISFPKVLLNTIEPDAFNGLISLKYLDLEFNFIKEIRNDTFSGLVGLKELHLSSNDILELKQGCFDPLTKLKFLDLSYNKIKKIQSGSLGLPNLKYLNLSFNNIEEFRAANLTNLVELKLNNNKLYKLDRYSFEGLINLKYLYLYYNFIHQLDAGCFIDLSKLVYLDLGSNSIRNLEAGALFYLRSLEVLILSYNNLSSIPEKKFYELTKLKKLFINDNKISSLDAENLLSHLPNLVEITLNNNTWQCSTLISIIDAFINRHVVILDGFTSQQINIDGVACKANYKQIKTHIDNIEKSKITAQTDLKVNKTDSQKTNDSFVTVRDIKHHLEKFEKEYKYFSIKLTVIGISLFTLVILVAIALFWVYARRKNLRNFTVRYSDIGLMND